MKSHLYPARLGAFAVTCITATAAGPTQYRVLARVPLRPARRPKVRASPAATGGTFSGSEQPWTVDVSGAAKSERSDAILAALTDAGGWGNDNVLQTDFSISIFNADGSTPRMNVVGIEDYCGGGPTATVFPLKCRCPTARTSKGRRTFPATYRVTPKGRATAICWSRTADEQKLYELYQANQSGDDIDDTGDVHLGSRPRSYPENLRGDQCTSADAAGFPIAAMTPTADEVASGAVNHAMRFILPNDRMKADVYVHPATHAGGPRARAPTRRPTVFGSG